MSNDTEFIPHSFQVPNDYVDRLLHLLTGDEIKIVIYASRRIFGFRKREDRISLSQFSHGITTKSGERLDHGTGLHTSACRKALQSLQKYGVVAEVEPANIRTCTAALYRLQLDTDQIDYNALEARQEAKYQKSVERTNKARSKATDLCSPTAQVRDRPMQSHCTDLCSPTTQTYAVPLHDKVTVQNPVGNPDHDEVLIAPSSRPEKTTKKPRATKPERTEEEQAILDRKKAIEAAYVTALGYTPAAFGREAKAAKWLAQQDYTPEQTIGCLRELQKDDFYRGKHISLETVAKQIGAWLKSRMPTRTIEYKRASIDTTDHAQRAAETRAYIEKIGWRPKHDPSRTT